MTMTMMKTGVTPVGVVVADSVFGFALVEVVEVEKQKAAGRLTVDLEVEGLVGRRVKQRLGVVEERKMGKMGEKRWGSRRVMEMHQESQK